MSDTPIFDELARKYDYDRLIAGAKKVPAYTGTSPRVMGIMAPGMYIDEWNGGQTDNAVNAAPTTPQEDDVVVFQRPIPVTTLADLAKGTHQE